MNQINEEDLRRYRQDTPGTQDLIHFNNAGTSLPPQPVVQAVIDYLQTEAINGGYETEARYAQALDDVYDSVAALIKANKTEIALFENASAAWLTAFKGLNLQAGDEVITSEMEYVSNLMALIDARKSGIVTKVIYQDDDGNFPLDTFEAAINSKTKLIAITHMPSSSGNVLPLEAIGDIARKHQVLYLVDACQTAGHYPIDVEAFKCDMLSATGRKYLRAPRGTGFLYVSQNVQHKLKPSFIDFLAVSKLDLDNYELRNDARRFELYEKSRALSLGLGKAANYAMSIGVDRIWARVQMLASQAREMLRSMPEVTVHDKGSVLSGIVTFSVQGFDSLALRDALISRRINVSFGGSYATLMYMKRSRVEGLVRASIHYYNTEEEVLEFGRVLQQIIKQAR